MKTAIWIRVSTLDQKRGDSPEVHEKRARLYAESKGWEIVTVYNLAGVSGKTVIEQEETKRMIQDVKEGRVEVLILSKLARLARSTRELLDIADLFKKHNATLVSMQENIDTSSSSGMLFYTILSAMAEWEISETSERIHASIATRRKMGKMAGGMASYGFKIVDAKLEVNQEEASVRKLM
jgi:site-specific DNA recombinase